METLSPPCIVEPIPGYILKERLGRGGYGEVWKALAPGSLHKAVKLVHGYHDEELAKRELQALERIKGVRHPFLVSIERIEVCDGQLIIVTELADMSLRDRFNDYRDTGKSGIPRDVLLAHLCDVADALDYISTCHNLQHLDVKPENLMIVGGRLKVGDFGLVRDLQQVTASLLSALTPIYAPPELFDGQPHRHSDQYSLAIVYQEMFTGRRPFRGTTAAQLTGQHLTDSPDLDSLPTSDREIVAKALAKNPDLRFGSCREFVDRLLDVDTSGNEFANGAASGNADGSDLAAGSLISESSTAPRADDQFQDATGIDGISSTVTVRPNRVVDLPRIKMAPENVRLRPTLFLGIGGFGARSLRKLRERLTDRFGQEASLPAFRTLYVDTDLKSIVQATQSDETCALEPHETLAMPLRRTQAYGVEKTKFLRWLSRRWLYNIPRSLNTEGRRPLGRVAFVDHVEALLERLRTVVAEMTSAESLAAAGAASGYDFTAAAPRIFIVSSVCGGTGGGMVLDMAYAVRQVLREQGLTDDAVHGVLAYASPRDPEAGELATANAYATLTELHHYSSPGSIYPGAADCELAATAGDDVAFPSVSFLDLGEGLTEEQFDHSADQVAEYIYFDATTACGTVFDEINRSAQQTAPLDSASIPLRTFHLHPHGGLRREIFAEVGGELCRRLMDNWLGVSVTATAKVDPAKATGDSGEADGMDDTAERFVQQEAATLTVDALAARLLRSAVERLGSPPKKFLTGLVNDASSQSPLEAIDRLVRVADDCDSKNTAAGQADLSDAVATDAKRMGAEHGRALSQRVLQLTDQAGVRVRGAQSVAAQLRERIDVSRREADHLMLEKEALLPQLRSAYLSPNPSRKTIALLDASCEESSSPRDALLLEYLLTQLVIIAIAGVRKTLRSIDGALLHAQQDLANITRCLESLGKRLPNSADDAGHIADSGLDIDEHLNAVARKSLVRRRDELVQRLDQSVRQTWLDQRGGLGALADSDPAVEEELMAEISRLGRATVLTAIKHLDLASEIVSLAEMDADGMECFRAWLEQIHPPALRGGGGAKTFLLAVGPESDPERLQQLVEGETQSHCSLIPHPDSALALVCCGEQLSLASVAHRLVHGSRTAEIAHRLHTRVDVDWKPMT